MAKHSLHTLRVPSTGELSPSEPGTTEPGTSEPNTVYALHRGCKIILRKRPLTKVSVASRSVWYALVTGRHSAKIVTMTKGHATQAGALDAACDAADTHVVEHFQQALQQYLNGEPPTLDGARLVDFGKTYGPLGLKEQQFARRLLELVEWVRHADEGRSYDVQTDCRLKDAHEAVMRIVLKIDDDLKTLQYQAHVLRIGGTPQRPETRRPTRNHVQAWGARL